MVKKKSFKRYLKCIRNKDEQIAAMKSLYPQFRAKLKGKNLFFTGKLKVKDDFPEYEIEIEYRGTSNPAVKVISPSLVNRPPHIYADTKSLCLYKPALYSWDASKLIAMVIVPWTAAWIYFYELWLITGEWLGPEAPHSCEKKLK